MSAQTARRLADLECRADRSGRPHVLAHVTRSTAHPGAFDIEPVGAHRWQALGADVLVLDCATAGHGSGLVDLAALRRDLRSTSGRLRVTAVARAAKV